MLYVLKFVRARTVTQQVIMESINGLVELDVRTIVEQERYSKDKISYV